MSDTDTEEVVTETSKDGHYKFTPAFATSAVAIILYAADNVLVGIEMSGTNLWAIYWWSWVGVGLAGYAVFNLLMVAFAIYNPLKISTRSVQVYERSHWYEYLRFGLLFFITAAFQTYGTWFQWSSFGDSLSLDDWKCNSGTLVTAQDIIDRQACLFNSSRALAQWHIVCSIVAFGFGINFYAFVPLFNRERQPEFTKAYLSSFRALVSKNRGEDNAEDSSTELSRVSTRRLQD